MNPPFIRTFVNKSIAPFPVYNKYKHVPVLKLLCFIFFSFLNYYTSVLNDRLATLWDL